MKIITLHQPWCYFVTRGWKTIETRKHKRFKSLVGQRIGIHSGLKWDNNWKKLAGPLMTDSMLYQADKFLKLGGAIIATAYVDEFRPLTTWDSMYALIDCSNNDRYGLILSKIHVLPDAIITRGYQGIWEYPIKEELLKD